MDLTTRNTLLIVFAILAAFVLIWAYQANRILKNPSVAAVTRQTQNPTSVPRTISQERSNQNQAQLNSRRMELQNEIRNLQVQLEQERADLQTQRQVLENLRAQYNQQQQQSAIAFPAQINANQAQIQNLSDSLESQRMAEVDISEASQNAINEQLRAAQVAREGIEANIAIVEESIQQTQQQMAALAATVPFDLTARDTQMAQLRNQLALQTQELDNLRAQRLDISSNTLNQSRAISSLTETQRAALTDNQSAILEQIAALREENVRLQNAQTETRMSSMTLSSQINQAERVVQNQAQEVTELEEALRQRQQTLQALR